MCGASHAELLLRRLFFFLLLLYLILFGDKIAFIFLRVQLCLCLLLINLLLLDLLFGDWLFYYRRFFSEGGFHSMLDWFFIADNWSRHEDFRKTFFGLFLLFLCSFLLLFFLKNFNDSLFIFFMIQGMIFSFFIILFLINSFFLDS